MSVVRTEILRYYSRGEGGKPVAAQFPQGWRQVVRDLQDDGLLEFCGGDDQNDYYRTTDRGRLLLESDGATTPVSAYFGGGDDVIMGPFEATGLIHDNGSCDLAITDPEFLDYVAWDLDEQGPFVFRAAKPFNGTVPYDSFAWGPPVPKTRFERVGEGDERRNL